MSAQEAELLATVLQSVSTYETNKTDQNTPITVLCQFMQMYTSSKGHGGVASIHLVLKSDSLVKDRQKLIFDPNI